jgi:hypothetical protein
MLFETPRSKDDESSPFSLSEVQHLLERTRLCRLTSRVGSSQIFHESIATSLVIAHPARARRRSQVQIHNRTYTPGRCAFHRTSSPGHSCRKQCRDENTACSARVFSAILHKHTSENFRWSGAIDCYGVIRNEKSDRRDTLRRDVVSAP